MNLKKVMIELNVSDVQEILRINDAHQLKEFMYLPLDAQKFFVVLYV